VPNTDYPTNIWPYYAKQNTSVAKERGSNYSLGKDDFLRILVAQLRHQDPMQPMEDKEFIAQMAMFSNVEQIYNMTQELRWLRQAMGISSDLIGKSIVWLEYDSNGKLVERSGVVDSIIIREGVQYVLVGDREVPIDYIHKIYVGQNQEPDPDPDDSGDDGDDGQDPDDGTEEVSNHE
jgi:flagellar basal-body rod modification protein FlgD